MKIKNKKYYLGINAYSHDSSACIMNEEGKIIAAVEEERFNQIKNCKGFPEKAIKFCLKKANVTLDDLKAVAVGWDTEKLLYDRMIKEYLNEHIPPHYVFQKTVKKFWGLKNITKEFERKIGKLPNKMKIIHYPHHIAHAASAFYASGFNDAAFLTIDARGEYNSSLWGTIDYKKGFKEKGTINHPNSLGCIWTAISEYCGIF